MKALDDMASPLDDIEKLLTAMRDRGAEMKAFDGLLSEISGALADIVGLLDKPKGAAVDNNAAVAKAITDGLAKLKAPNVNVNVQPTPISVNVPKADAPVVNVQPASWSKLHVKVTQSAGGNKEFTITKS